MRGNAEYQAKLDKLTERYRAALPQRLAQMRAAWAQVADEDDRDALADLHRVAHSLAGSGQTFGYAAVSRVARELETALAAALATGTLADHVRQSDFDAWLSALEQAANGPPQRRTNRADPATFPADKGTPRVYLLEDDTQLAEHLVRQLRFFDYETEAFESVDALLAACEHKRPDALVADVALPEDPEGGLRAARYLNDQAQGKSVPVMFISGRDDFEARLAAVRAGGRAYLAKPVDVDELIEELDRFSGRTLGGAFRVLLIDDDEALADSYALTLTRAGIEARVVTRAREAATCVDDFRPDLLLVDFYLPECHGLELVSIIRQNHAHASLPVIFLSTEADPIRQMEAVTTFGDDFIAKPIEPERLVGAVSARARRARLLAGLMSRDSLTGLLNHGAVKDEARAEISRVRRLGTRASLVMLDVDHFKQVNDRYGHAAGDRVLKSLARLLRQSLRETDSIGRYGGEEFLVLLPDSRPEDAARRLDGLRRRFAAIEHHAGDEMFRCTFSAGVASAEARDNVEAWLEAADGALYRAKAGGRDQILLAD